MAQLTLYVPDDLLARLKTEARAAHSSLSAYVVSRLETSRPDRRDALKELYGSCDLGPPPRDPVPDEPPPL